MHKVGAKVVPEEAGLPTSTLPYSFVAIALSKARPQTCSNPTACP